MLHAFGPRVAFSAYCVPEPHSESEPEAGSVTFRVLQNCPDQAGKEPDAQTLVWLMGVKNVFSRQLPKMPKEYIVRLGMSLKGRLSIVRSCFKPCLFYSPPPL